MKKIFLIFITTIMMATFMVGCGKESGAQDNADNNSDTIKVLVSFHAMEELVELVGDEKVDVEVVIPEGTEAHDFEPTTKDIKELSKSKLFVYNGLGMEHWVENFLKNSNVEVVEASANVTTINNDGVIDPHTWLGLKDAIVELENIKNALVKIDSKNSTYYEKNYENAKKELVEKNLRLVVYIAKKFENSGINIEDLISIGTIGLMKAINSYNVDKNIKLATYASRCIENEILMYLRKTQKQKSEVSIDEPINTDSEGNDLALADILGTENDAMFKQVEDNDNKKIINIAIKNLDDREKIIMQLRYGFDGRKELTQKEVAQKLGISQSYISRIEKKVIERLKKDFEEP